MTAATDLIAGLAPSLGPAEKMIHTALPPLFLGGGADVIEFRHAPSLPGTIHVSAGLGEQKRAELVIVTRKPEPWAPTMLSQLAKAGLRMRFADNGTVPLGDPASPFAGLLFRRTERFGRVRAGAAEVGFLAVVGITADELAACRSHGTPFVVERLEAANVFPYSEPGRPSVLTAPLPPSPLLTPGLSDKGKRALSAVVHTDHELIEALRATFEKTDLPVLASVYDSLAWEQRCALTMLVSDSLDPALPPIWRKIVRDAAAHPIEESTFEHVALASALAGLDGNLDRFTTYFDDLALAMARARQWANA